jgi:competence protein ComEC
MSDTHRIPTRPIVLIAIAFWLGVLIAASISAPSIPFLLMVAFTVGLIAYLLQEKAHIPHAALVIFFIAAGAVYSWARHAGPPGDELQRLILSQPEDAQYTVHGIVARPNVLLPQDDYTQFQLRVTEVIVQEKKYTFDGEILVRWSNPDTPLIHGETVRLTGPLLPTIQQVNHGVSGVEEYYRLQGVHSSMRLRGPHAVERLSPSAPWSITARASQIRQFLAERLTQATPAEALPFVLTVWLGDRNRIDNEASTAFLESGTAHILAVSGVHIGIIYITLAYALRLITRNNRARIIITLAAILLFALIAGARISSLRAAAMIALYLAAEWFEREPDAPTALGLSALLFGIHNPDVIFMAGFQLSYLCIASLLLFRKPIAEYMESGPRFLREGLSSVFAVQILPLPATVLTFNILAFGSLIANLIILPLLSIVLWLAIATTILACIAPPLAQWFGHATLPFVWLIESIATSIADLKFTHTYVTSPTPIALIGYGTIVAALIAGFYKIRSLRWSVTAAVLGLVLCFAFWKPWTHTADITFLDVGHGDAAVVRTPLGKTILIDGGDRNEFQDRGSRTVAHFLWAHHISKLDAIFVSHTDRDHLGGLYYILEHFPVGTLFIPPGFGDNEDGQQFLDHCAKHDVHIEEVYKGHRIDIGDCVVKFLHPDADPSPGQSDNNRSLVFTLTSDDVTVLFTGDIEKRAERELSNEGPIRADVIKVPHHGSNTSSTSDLLESISVSHAVVSSGMRRDKPLAKAEVLQRYTDLGVSVHRTDYGGSVRVSREEEKLVVTSARLIGNIAVRP